MYYLPSRISGTVLTYVFMHAIPLINYLLYDLSFTRNPRLLMDQYPVTKYLYDIVM